MKDPIDNIKANVSKSWRLIEILFYFCMTMEALTLLGTYYASLKQIAMNEAFKDIAIGNQSILKNAMFIMLIKTLGLTPFIRILTTVFEKTKGIVKSSKE